jgi:hypothetical protein
VAGIVFSASRLSKSYDKKASAEFQRASGDFRVKKYDVVRNRKTRERMAARRSAQPDNFVLKQVSAENRIRYDLQIMAGSRIALQTGFRLI